jgi:hypothetical protein
MPGFIGQNDKELYCRSHFSACCLPERLELGRLSQVVSCRRFAFFCRHLYPYMVSVKKTWQNSQLHVNDDLSLCISTDKLAESPKKLRPGFSLRHWMVCPGNAIVWRLTCSPSRCILFELSYSVCCAHRLESAHRTE